MIFGKNKKHLSKKELEREELTRTQVLNLQELERVANYETQTSKRPAALFAFAGLLSISLGITYPNIMMAVDSISFVKTVETEQVEQHEELNKFPTELPVATDKILCSKIENTLPDGTNKMTNYELFFKDSKLQGYKKQIVLSPIVDNVNGATTVENFYNQYLPLKDLQIVGYKVLPEKEIGATKITIDIDLSILDKSTLVYNMPNNQNNILTSNPFTNVEYNFEMDKVEIQNNIIAQGFTCQ